ncbi:MAG: hypothetical protein Q9165_008167 [Trypethelium subeluteriae]
MAQQLTADLRTAQRRRHTGSIDVQRWQGKQRWRISVKWAEGGEIEQAEQESDLDELCFFGVPSVRVSLGVFGLVILSRWTYTLTINERHIAQLCSGPVSKHQYQDHDQICFSSSFE